MSDAPIRIDKWLWHARFFKSRSLAAAAVKGGSMRVNGQIIAKPSATLRPGDVLTFVQARQVRVIKMLAPGERRGPAPEAQTLYEDLEPPQPRTSAELGAGIQRAAGGRPTGKARRDFDAGRNAWLE